MIYSYDVEWNTRECNIVIVWDETWGNSTIYSYNSMIYSYDVEWNTRGCKYSSDIGWMSNLFNLLHFSMSKYNNVKDQQVSLTLILWPSRFFTLNNFISTMSVCIDNQSFTNNKMEGLIRWDTGRYRTVRTVHTTVLCRTVQTTGTLECTGTALSLSLSL